MIEKNTMTKCVRSRFYSRSALIMLAMVLASFPVTYFAPVLTGSARFAPIYHIHGTAFFAWITLYAWQTHLVAAERPARHRELGLWGLALSGMMVPLGWALAIAAIERRIANGDPNAFDSALYNVVDIVTFTVLMTASIAAVTRHVEWHRRFTFAAAVALVGPAISRWFYATPMPTFPPFTDFGPNIVADLFIVALAVHDCRSTGRLHPVTLGYLVVMVPIHVLTPLVATSVEWRSVAPALLTTSKMLSGMAG